MSTGTCDGIDPLACSMPTGQGDGSFLLNELKPEPGSDEERSRTPRCSSEKSFTDKVPPPSTLHVADFMVSCKMPRWEDEAMRIFQESGFVVVLEVLNTSQCKEVLQTCQQLAEEIVALDPKGNRAPGRYSFGVASSTGSILHLPSISTHLLSRAGVTLDPLLSKIFSKDGKADFMCYSGGGDFVLPGVEEYQFLHGDMQMNPDDVRMPPPFLSVNFCVQALTSFNGPIRMVPGKTELDWDRRTEEEPAEWRHSRLFPVPAGAALLRDVRILHGGTPNWSEQTRYLPSIEYVSGELRAEKDPEMFPPSRSIPWYVYETLPERVQHLCQELVAEKADPGCPDPDDQKPWESIYWHGARFRRTCHD